MNVMSNKKISIFIVCVIVVLITIVVGFTAAYFLGTVNTDARGDINVTLSENAKLEFKSSGNLNISAGLNNFYKDGNNLSSSVIATAILTAPSLYHARYYTYFRINNNDFVYTTDEEIPELVLTIQKPDGSYVSSVNGLDVTMINGHAGFDVTTMEGIFKIEENISISTTDELKKVEQGYLITLHLINLDSNQNDNASKTFDSEFIMQKDKYRLPILGKASDTLINNHSEVEGLIKHSYDVLNSASDNNYRYMGANPENYIMFNNEIWRIIGIYEMYGNKHLKIIRNDSIGDKVMNEDENNSWGDSDIVSYLNDEYYTTLDTNSKSMVYKMYYFIGGYEDIYGTAKAYYDTESSYESNESYMGLMTPSDYGFASSKDNWGTDMSSYDNESNKNNNWLFKGYDMWTMTSDTIAWHIFHYVDARGQVGSDMCYRSHAILPVLYLDPDVEIISGYGTEDIPFILNS